MFKKCRTRRLVRPGVLKVRNCLTWLWDQLTRGSSPTVKEGPCQEIALMLHKPSLTVGLLPRNRSYLASFIVAHKGK